MKPLLPENTQKYAAEFIGTYMLVFSIGCNVAEGSKIWFPLSIAATLTVAVYIFGSVSGANFNPAVSVVLGLTGKKSWPEVAKYVAIQIVAGILAALTYGLILWQTFTLQPGKGYTWWHACLAEMIYTCMLCFVVLHVSGDVPEAFEPGGKANGAAGNQYFGLAIGFVLMAAIPAGGHISGGCFNPAVAIGIDFSSKLLKLYWCFPYICFQILGAGLAAVLFKLTDPLQNLYGGEPNMKAKLVSEFVGTFYLVLTVGLNVLGKTNAPVYSIAASLMCMIFALGRVSGAHLNPAVTAAILYRGGDKIGLSEVLPYMSMQFLGGLAGAVLYAILENGKTFSLEKGAGFGWTHVAGAEILFTFLLCYVVLAVATTRTAKTQFFGLAIASCVVAGGVAIGTISGGVLNPAVAFGVAATSLMGGASVWNCIYFFIFEFVGGLLAAGVFRFTRPSEYGYGKA